MHSPIPRLPQFDLTDVFAATDWPPPDWSGVAGQSMGQAWRSTPQPEFLPARVWLACTVDAFAVLAELEDHDINTRGRVHNDPLWDLGDVFEIFVRHAARPEYFEFHVAPNNVTLDLRYPRLYASRARGVEGYMLTEPQFTARAVIETDRHRWRVAARLPVSRLAPPDAVAAASAWQFSFCRYDCGPGRPDAVASTSPHAAPDFHRGEEWPVFTAPAFVTG